MRLRKFRLRNQKCFVDTEELSFGPGFNVVVGINNAGKSALLEGMQATFVGNPARNIKTQPRETDLVNPISQVDMGVELSGGELRRALLRMGSQFQLPINKNIKKIPTDEIAQLEAVLSLGRLGFSLRCQAKEGNGLDALVGSTYPSMDEAPKDAFRAVLYQPNATMNGFEVASHEDSPNPGQEVGKLVGDLYRQRTYRFVAERMNVGKYSAGVSKDLVPNALNLPEVLANLQSNHARFSEYNSVVRQIFPTVNHISVRHASASEVEVFVSSSAGADHLAVPLQRSGTGIAQVLSVLYVVMTSTEPRTIIIDEPNSFLHPGAARKLMETLKDFPAHQFIIATHSPEIIRSVPTDRLMMITWTEQGSTVAELKSDDVNDMTSALREIGARISDVIAADSIFWVEGPSEEECFPLVLRRLAKRKMSGSLFVALKDTGGFEKKHLTTNTITRLYEKLSRGGSVVPRAIGFSFDREGRTEAEIAHLRNKHQNIYFLPRRMLENFLIVPQAIAHVLNAHLHQEHHVSSESVDKWIKANGRANKYFNPLPAHDVFSQEWLATVHAGKLLEDLFQDVSEARAEFRKTRDDPALVDYLLSTSDSNMRELCSYLETITSESGASVAPVLKDDAVGEQGCERER